MTARCRQLTSIIAIALASLAPCVSFAQTPDESDFPAPIFRDVLQKPKPDKNLNEGPVPPPPYVWLEDEPETSAPQSTISMFETAFEDVGPFSLLERPGVPVGWFTSLEVAAVNPRISARQQSESLLSGTFASPVAPPSTPLDWSIMPTLTVGYRRPEGLGDLSASYRFLFSQGTDSISPIGGGSGTRSSNLQLHVVDLDCTFADLFPNDLWLVPRQTRLSAGIRVAGIRDRVSAQGGTIVGQTASNTFVGAGPHVAFETLYPIASNRFEIFTKFDGAGVIGADRQTFSQTIVNPGPTFVSGAASSATSAIATPVIGVRAGLNWYPAWGCGNVKMSAGYQWERWFNLGINSSSYSELTIQGPFVRGEIAF